MHVCRRFPPGMWGFRPTPPFPGLSADSERDEFETGGKPSQKPLSLKFTRHRAKARRHPLLGFSSQGRPDVKAAV